ATTGQNPAISLSGVVPIANGGTGLNAGPASATQFLRANATATGWINGSIAASDLPSLSGTYVDLTTAQTITGVKTFMAAIAGDITGNAGTVTNGVYTNQSYADPTWLTSLAGTKVIGAVAAALSFTGALTGDVTGTQGATRVLGIAGHAVAAT